MNTQQNVLLSSEDRLDIIECVTGMGFFADTADWSRLAACYDDIVTIDYKKLIGTEPVTLVRDDLIAFFQSSLTQWDGAQHLISNVQISAASGELATTQSHAQTVQIFKGRQWTIGGYFTHQLRKNAHRWQIYSQRLTPIFEVDPTGVKSEWMQGLKT